MALVRSRRDLYTEQLAAQRRLAACARARLEGAPSPEPEAAAAAAAGGGGEGEQVELPTDPDTLRALLHQAEMEEARCVCALVVVVGGGGGLVA